MKKNRKKINLFFILIMIVSIISCVNKQQLVIEEKIEEKIEEPKKEKNLLNELNIGEEIIFGKYYNIENNEIKLIPIEWQIVAKTNEKVLLMTKNIIDNIKYNNRQEAITWEKSSLRKWLNEEFYNIAFTKEEKKIILETEIKTLNNPIYQTNGGINTKDKIFTLSLEEALEYFGEANSARKAKGTEYAMKNGLWVSHLSESSDGYSVWTLRTPGQKQSFTALILATGVPDRKGDAVTNTGNGIRPCMWLKIE